MKMIKSRWLWRGLLAFLAVLLFGSLCPAPRPTIKKALRANSVRRISELGSDVERHIRQNGQKPGKLSDIVNGVPNATDKETYFRIPGRVKNLQASAATNDFRYEDYSDYVLVTNQASELLIYEKPGIRNDNTVYYYKKGFGVWKLKRKEFEERLKSGKFPPPWK
jgi:hypothetical protein